MKYFNGAKKLNKYDEFNSCVKYECSLIYYLLQRWIWINWSICIYRYTPIFHNIANNIPCSTCCIDKASDDSRRPRALKCRPASATTLCVQEWCTLFVPRMECCDFNTCWGMHGYVRIPYMERNTIRIPWNA